VFYSRHRTETGEPRRFFRFAADMTPDKRGAGSAALYEFAFRSAEMSGAKFQQHSENT